MVGVPMADGGEGTVDAIVDALGRHIVVDVQDPLGRLTRASYGYVPHRRLAVMEIAAAAGLELVAPTSETYCTPAASASATHQVRPGSRGYGIPRRTRRVRHQRRRNRDAHRPRRTIHQRRVIDLSPGGAALQQLHRSPDALDPRLHHARIRPGMGCRRIAQYAAGGYPDRAPSHLPDQTRHGRLRDHW